MSFLISGSKYSATFAGSIMANLQTILERDTELALRSIDADLEIIKHFDTPVQITTNFPCAYLDPDTSQLSQSDDDAYIQGQHRFALTLSIVGSSANTLKTSIMKYVRALDQVIRTASAADISGTVTSVSSKCAWEVTEHRFGPLGSFNSIYRRDAQLVIVVQLLER